MIKFALVGFSGVFVNLAVVYVVEHLLRGASGAANVRSIAYFAGIVVSIFTNFLMNDGWTWRDRTAGSVASFWARCGNFYVTSAGAAALQFGASWATDRSDLFARSVLGFDLNPAEAALAALVGIAVATPVNYLVNHFWTFRRRL